MSKIRWFVVFIFLCCSLTACTNMGAVGKFADGAQALSRAAGRFYGMELDTDRQIAMTTIDLGAKHDIAACQKNDGSFLTPWDCATKGENLISEARRNRAAVAALAQYAQSLKEMAEFNDDANIEETSKELSGNLSVLAKSLDPEANTNESILANAISGLAKVYIDLKVRKAVYHKVRLAQEDVVKIVIMMRDDIKRQKARLAVSRINAKATREEWFNAFKERYQSNQALIVQNATTHARRAELKSENAKLTIAAGTLVGDELADMLSTQPSIIFMDELDRTARQLSGSPQSHTKPESRRTG